ncbi:MAG: NAD-dependent epimerase/dehydratase family protein [Acidobacteria bacterium]|nr:NAD-dependent epimerase/dehydratase family protein [Acidobacteriota bacterium]
MRVLVTGGTGFLGREVARLLLAGGHQVTLLVRPGREPADLEAGLATVPGDVTDPSSLAAALGRDGGPQAVLHLAALVQMWMPNRRVFDQVNVQGFLNVLQAARAARVERVVYSSSFMALGPSRGRPRREEDPPAGPPFHNDYQRTKYLADQVARERMAAGWPLVTVYPGVVYGPGTLTAGGLVTRQILIFLTKGLPGILGPGDRAVCYAYIKDVAAGVVAALERGRIGRGYILGGENATLNQFMATLSQVSGKPAPTRHIPYGVAWWLGRLQWAWAEISGRPPELTHQVVDIYRESWAYDATRAREELGYTITPLAQGLADTVAWLRAAGHVS